VLRETAPKEVPKLLLNAPADDENELLEAGPLRVEDRVVKDRLAAGSDGLHLFQSAVPRADSGGQNHQCRGCAQKLVADATDTGEASKPKMGPTTVRTAPVWLSRGAIDIPVSKPTDGLNHCELKPGTPKTSGTALCLVSRLRQPTRQCLLLAEVRHSLQLPVFY
jgi:hypothetical protein